MTILEPLTPEIIRCEPAGRRLDSWLAERVMGLSVSRESLPPFHPAPRVVSGTDPIGSAVPRYSIDIAAAWVVWEWMRLRGSSLSLYASCEIGEPTECSWITGGKRFTHVSGKEDMAVVICKTALIATLEAP